MTHTTTGRTAYMHRKRISLSMASLAMLACSSFSTSQAADNDFANLSALTQAEFQTLSENMAAVTTYKAIAPAEPLGITGFDLAVGLSRTAIDDEIFEISSVGDWDISSVPLVRGSAQKGLPFGIDVGGSLAMVPETDIIVMGAEIRYALVKGGVATPAVAIRAAYSTLQGVDELEFDNKSVDLSISKGFITFTPYAGIGQVFSESTAVGVAGLDKVDVDETRIFAGLNINLGMNIGLEIDSMAGYQTYTAKLGLRF